MNPIPQASPAFEPRKPILDPLTMKSFLQHLGANMLALVFAALGWAVLAFALVAVPALCVLAVVVVFTITLAVFLATLLVALVGCLCAAPFAGIVFVIIASGERRQAQERQRVNEVNEDVARMRQVLRENNGMGPS